MDQALSRRIDAFIEAHREDMINTLFDLARIPSVQSAPEAGMPYGAACARALDRALELCADWGMQVKNYDYRCGSARWGEGVHELGFVAHLDVVPAGDGWSGKPFEPFLRDGFAVGRGVRDNKNGAVCGMFAVRCIRELDIPMKHSLRLIFGCAEETGMDDLPYYLQAEKAPDFSIVPDTAFPVCHGEKGIYTGDFLLPCTEELLSFGGGLAANVVPDRAEARVRLLSDAPVQVGALSEHVSARVEDGVAILEARGITSHAARPQGSVNAIRELAAALQGAVYLSEQTRASMAFIADMLADPYGERIGIAAQDAPSGKLTCISGLASLNEEAHTVKLSLNIRYPVTHEGAKITEGLNACAKQHGVSFVLDDDDKPSYLSADHPAVRSLSRVYEDVTGRDATPYVMGGGTYARHLPNAVAFGPDDPGEELPCPAGHGDCHQPDECQSIRGLMQAVKIYVHALLALDAN